MSVDKEIQPSLSKRVVFSGRDKLVADLSLALHLRLAANIGSKRGVNLIISGHAVELIEAALEEYINKLLVELEKEDDKKSPT